MKKLITSILAAVLFSVFTPTFCSPTSPETFHATCSIISPQTLKHMPHTWRDDSPVPLKDLRHITVSHLARTENTKIVRTGELIVHKLVAHEVIAIFSELFEIGFEIVSIKFIDEFEGNDDASMAANNSSAFYARKVAGAKRWSNHSYGLAIDINPLFNPYTRGELICPPEGKAYLNTALRTKLSDSGGLITKKSKIYKIFKRYGWEWGGECFSHCCDRHHFQKVIPGINQSMNS